METMNTEMNTELVCVMASLGYYDDDEYYMGNDCMESLKDLIRFLRKEDENCNIRRQMGCACLLQKDLLPMLIHMGDNEELVDIVVRLLVNLTSPVDICFNKMTDEAEEGNKKEKMTNTFQTKHLEVISYLQEYKRAFTSEKSLSAIGAQLGRILQMEFEDRDENNLLLFERLLLLLRNILHVPASPEDELRTDDDASLHDQVLWSMHINGIDDLIIYVSSTPEEARWTMHVIEIIALMFREQNPETLAKSSKEKSESEKAEITRDLLLAREKEEAIKKVASKKMVNARHSRFGGTYWVKNMKGVGNINTLVHHGLVADAKDISFDEKKYPRRVPKRKQPAKPTEVEKRSTLKIRLFLKEFCKKFLELSYNPMMRQVKDSVIGKTTQDNDDTYYIWGMRFFMVFNRAHSFKVEYVSETLNLNTFHYILKQINTYYDQFIMHKRGGWEPWAKRLHKALQSYKELLTYVSNMDQSHDDVLKDASSVIKNNIFYHEEYRSIFLVLLRHYVICRHTRQFLADLIDTFHIFIKLLDKFCQTKGSLLVKSKKKVSKKRKKGGSAGTETVPSAMTAEQLEELWENDLAPALSGIIQGYETLPENISSPFDPASDVPVDEQRGNAMIRIQDLLRSGECGEAVALLRASRECWPDETLLGSENSPPEDEFTLFRNLLVMELERPRFEEPPVAEENEEDEEEEDASVRSVEREFHLKSFLFSLVSPQMMIPYNMQLAQFKTNSSFTNHAVVKMMHRVACDMKFPEMFFQLSMFRTFEEVMELEMPRYKELEKFGRYIILKFTEAAIENPNIYVETLIWKGTGDCYQISSREPEKTNAAKEKWTPAEEEELKTLYDQYKEAEDVVGEIVKNISDGERTRRKVINKLVALQCVENAKDLPNPDKAAGNWTYEQEEELKTLFDQYKEAEDVVGDILKNISDPDLTRRKITNKLVRLRLVENAKQLPKPPKPKVLKWTEEQTEELHRLFDEYKETGDILTNIMVTMTFKKSRNAIIKQLLETGKVDDRTMLYKKKKKKDGKGAFKEMVNEEEEDEEKIYDDWSDEEVAEPAKTRNMNSEDNNSEDGNSEDGNSEDDNSEDDNSEDDDIENDTSTSIVNLVQKVKEEFSQQVIWLQTRLRRAADDRDEDSDWYAMPLLTITEEDDTAMQNKDFKKLLLAIGLRPPADEQEMFWRIDEKLTPQRLRKFANDLDKSGDALDDTRRVSDISDSLGNSTKNEEEAASKPAITKPTITKPTITKPTKRRFAISDSDDDGDDDDGGDDNEEKEELVKQKSAKRKRILEDDDDDSDMNENETEDFDDSVPLHELLSNDGTQRGSDENMVETGDVKKTEKRDILRDTTNLSDSDNDDEIDMDVDKKNRSALDSSLKMSDNEVS